MIVNSATKSSAGDGLRQREFRPTDSASNGVTALPRRPYPNSWFAMCLASELPPGTVLRRRLAGEDIVLYRTKSGLLRAIRPYCPHLGAHLGFGGAVENEELVCPFHRFAYSPSGACVRTGYGSQPSPALRLQVLESREVDGLVLVWCHTGSAAPDWEVPDTVPPALRPRRLRATTIVDHPQEVFENSVDIGHFRPVHNNEISDFNATLTDSSMQVSLNSSPASGGIGILTGIRMHIVVTMYGLGFMTAYVKTMKSDTRVRFWILPTPVDPVHIELRLGAHVERVLGHRPPRFIGDLLDRMALFLFCQDVARDFPIWQNKTYVEKPVLAKGDGPIMRFRRWASTFYSEQPPPSMPSTPSTQRDDPITEES